MPPLRTAAALVGLVINGAAAGADAQPASAAAPDGVSPPALGNRVRARVTGPGTPWPNGAWCEGRVTAVVGDTVQLDRSGRCPPGAYAAEFQVARGGGVGRGGGAVLGAVGGGLLGFVTARLAIAAQRDRCDPRLPCGGPHDIGAAFTTLSASAAGAVLGAGVGLVLTEKVRWRSAGPYRTLHVAALAGPHPGVAVSIGPARR